MRFAQPPYRPAGSPFGPERQRRYLPDGCAVMLVLPVTLLAIALLFFLALHPQGFDLIPWIFHHL